MYWLKSFEMKNKIHLIREFWCYYIKIKKLPILDDFLSPFLNED